MTQDELRQENSRLAAWAALEEELAATLKGVASANLIRRHRLGLAALQAYGVTRMLVRKDEHANLLPHFEAMRRANRFGKKRKVGQSPPEQPAPEPHGAASETIAE
jgi:hypothetical protein